MNRQAGQGPDASPRLSIHRPDPGHPRKTPDRAPSTARLVIGGSPVDLAIWPSDTWTMMDFPPGVSRASCGRWLAVGGG